MNQEIISLSDLPLPETLVDPDLINGVLEQLKLPSKDPFSISRIRLRPGRNIEITLLLGKSAALPVSLPVVPGILTLLVSADHSPSDELGNRPTLDQPIGDHSLRVWLFPEDRKLKGLTQFLNPDTVAGKLNSNLGVSLKPGEIDTTLVQYVASRSCTIRIGIPGARYYAKAYVSGAAAAAWEVQRRVFELVSGTVRLSRPLFQTGEEIWQEELPGVSFDQLGNQLPEALEKSAVALASLHALPAEGANEAASRIQVLDETGRLFKTAMPLLAPRVARLIDALKLKMPELQAGFIHGDLHLRNLIYDEGEVGIIDLDNAGPGDPAGDLGSLAASLHYRELTGQGGSAEELFETILTAYGKRRSDLFSLDSVNWHIAYAALCERASRCLTRVKLQPQGIVSALLDVAEEYIQRS